MLIISQLQLSSRLLSLSYITLLTAVNGFHYCGPLRVIIIINAGKIILGNLFPGRQMQKQITLLSKCIYALLRGI